MTMNDTGRGRFTSRVFACLRGSLILLLLAACAGREPAPVAVLQAAALPSGWQPIELSTMQLALPAEWSVLGAEPEQSAPLQELATQHPQLEALLQSAAAELAAGELELIAVDLAPAADDASGYPASLRIGRQMYRSAVSLDDAADANERELRSTPAFAAVVREPVRIGEHAAERLRSQVSLSPAGEPLTLVLEQYVLVSGSDVLVLTFAAAEESAARYRATWDGVLSTLRLIP